MKLINRFMNDDSGATLIEYALVVALISIVAIVALQTVGTDIKAAFENIAGSI